MKFTRAYVLLLAVVPRLSAQSATNVVSHISSVRTICAEDFLSKNHESNMVLFDILDGFYTEFEDQFRKQVQRQSDIWFVYLGSPSDRGAVKFPAVVGPDESKTRCDGSVRSAGEVRAITPTTFQVTVYLNVNRNMTAAEVGRLNEAEKSRLSLWSYKLTSTTFSKDRLIYTAHLHALEVAASLVAASTRSPRP